MNELMLTLAVSDYDHTADIVSGRVKPEGITLRPLDLQIEEIFYRFTLFQEWDLCEMSFGKYVSMISQNAPVTALPVFISRVFRHSSFFVRKDGPVKTPADLKGARLGLPEWAQTASIYSRGLLQHTYGLDLASIQWVQAGINQKGRVEKVELKLPPGVSIERHPDKTLSDMLERGEVDAVMVARPPNAFLRGHPNIKRMFENYRELEADYYRETGIFPIMHVLAMRKKVVDDNPWVAMNLFNAFEEAKNRSVERARDFTASHFPVAWHYDHAREVEPLFGQDLWPYGLEPNRKSIEAFLKFAYEQGVCHRPVAPEELFPKQVLKGRFAV